MRMASLFRGSSARALAHAGHAQVLAQHRRDFHVEIVQRHDATRNGACGPGS